MTSITAPIGLDDRGNAVANLHEALRRLDLTGVLGEPQGAQEVRDRIYGPMTREAVARFQAQFNVTVSSEDERGIVTEATAAMFNRVLGR
jgi:peptidoglycan hydrolase-like protein with peptidoglycan-binding domain